MKKGLTNQSYYYQIIFDLQLQNIGCSQEEAKEREIQYAAE